MLAAKSSSKLNYIEFLPRPAKKMQAILCSHSLKLGFSLVYSYLYGYAKKVAGTR